MKNLTKYLLLAIVIFPVVILLSSVLAEKSSAQQKGTCSQVSGGWRCSFPSFKNTTYGSLKICNEACATATPTPTGAPCPNGTVGNTFFACQYSCRDGEKPEPLTCSRGSDGYERFCCSAPVTTLTPTPTPTPILTPEECSAHCGARTVCAKCPEGNFVCGTTDISQCSAPVSKLVWKRIAICPTPAPTRIPTPTPTPAQIVTVPTSSPDPAQTTSPTSVPTPIPTPTPLPSSANIGTETNPFQCVDQAGSFSGNYQCAGVTNGSPQCPGTFSPFNFSPTFITSCGQNQVCCKQNPVTTPSPTPLPGSVQLALTLTQQGLTDTPVNRSRSVTVVLKGADDQLIAKTGTADYSNGTFNGTINLGVLPAGSYKLKVEVGNFLKSLITNLVISGTTASSQTTIVAGLTDQYNDNVDAISFYANGLRTCFGSTLGVKKCDKPEDVDLNGDANIDVIDYQIYLKGIRSLKQGLPVL